MPTFSSLEETARRGFSKNRISKQQGNRMFETNSCANFSGRWRGTCKDEGGVESKTQIVIEQSFCSGLTIISQDQQGVSDRTEFDLAGAGIESRTKAGGLMSFNIALAAKWSSDRQVLNYNGAALINSPVLASQQLMTLVGHMMKDGDELVTLSKSTGNWNGDNENSCRYQLEN